VGNQSVALERVEEFSGAVSEAPLQFVPPFVVRLDVAICGEAVIGSPPIQLLVRHPQVGRISDDGLFQVRHVRDGDDVLHGATLHRHQAMRVQVVGLVEAEHLFESV